MDLPIEFISRMKKQLKDEYKNFIDSYDNETYRGIRVNTIKITVEDFLKITDFELIPVPWCNDGFYIKGDLRPAKHPHYFAGLFYIQEPSAMLPAVILNVKKNNIVLDLCAAPGGKTMQLAASMQNEGILIANDINTNRIKALIRNCELLGVTNIIVLNEKQENIASKIGRSFDKILIDAPCSGEGMFKKHDGAINAYAEYNIESCVKMQREILYEVNNMINGQGELVYSTCTFNENENEEMIQLMIDELNFKLVPLEANYGFKQGNKVKEVLRLYPHLIKGEGHFVGKVKNEEEYKTISINEEKNKPPELLLEFMKENMHYILEGYFEVIKDKVFLLPQKRLQLIGLRTSKKGWYLGELKKNRFVPSHAFALGIKKEDFKNIINLEKNSIEIIKYLKCETLKLEGTKGFNLICVDGHPIGWGKWANGTLKNLYPAAWRLQ